MGAAALAMTLVLTGCFGEEENNAAEPAAEPEVSEPAEEELSPEPSEEESEAEVVAATKDDLLSMEVPDVCPDLGGKRLIDGKLVWKPTGAHATFVDTFAPFAIDADGDGADELIAVLHCEVGDGARWPHQIVLVDAGGAVLDAVDHATGLESGTEVHTGIDEWTPGEKEVKLTSQIIKGGQVTGIADGTVSAAAGKLVFKKGATSAAPAPSETASSAAPQQAPAAANDEFKDAKFSSMGYGPLGLTTSGKKIVEKGWGIDTGTDDCPGVEPSPLLKEKGIQFLVEYGLEGELWELFAVTDHAKTPSGAHVGMTVEDLKKIYGPELKSGADPYHFYVDVEAKKSMTFQVSGGVVTKMGVHNFASQHLWDIRGYC